MRAARSILIALVLLLIGASIANATYVIWFDTATANLIQQDATVERTPAAISNASNCALDAAGAHALATAEAGPNGGITVNATPDASGNCNGATFTNRATPTPTPKDVTLALNANAGTGATIGFIAGSNANRGAITWTAGTSPAAGVQFVATFPVAFGSLPVAPCVAANRPAAAIRLYATPSTASVTVGSDAAPTNGQTYICQYVVVP